MPAATAEMIDNPVAQPVASLSTWQGALFLTLVFLGNCTVCSKSKSFHASWPVVVYRPPFIKALSLLWSG